MNITEVHHAIANPRILFFALANDIGQERLPAQLTKLGASCAMLSPPGLYVTKTRYLEPRFNLPPNCGFWLSMPFARTTLEAAVRCWQPHLLVALDDVAALLLRNLHGMRSVSQGLRNLIATSFGTPCGYRAACSRAKLMEIGAQLPVRIPRYHIADDMNATLKAAAAWGYPVVLKAEHTCGGRGVVIAANAAELRAAMALQKGARALWRRWRAAGKHCLWKLAGITDGGHGPSVLQEMIRGVPAMRTVGTWNGEVLEGASFVAERIHPEPTGASSMVRHIEHPEMEATTRLLVRALGCSGFVSFDFVLDARDGAAYLIEMNPRPIGTTHLGRVFGHDIVGALFASLCGEPKPQCAPGTWVPESVALFPKELERDPAKPERLTSSTVFHDVPDDDPGVVAAYLRRLSRIHPQAAEEIARFVAQDADARRVPPVVADRPARPGHPGGRLARCSIDRRVISRRVRPLEWIGPNHEQHRRLAPSAVTPDACDHERTGRDLDTRD